MKKVSAVALAFMSILVGLGVFSPAKAGAAVYTDYGWWLAEVGSVHIRAVNGCMDPGANQNSCYTVQADWWDGSQVWANKIWDVMPAGSSLASIWAGNGSGASASILYTTAGGCGGGSNVCGYVWGVNQSPNNAYCRYWNNSCLSLAGGSYYDPLHIQHWDYYPGGTKIYAVTSI